MTVQKQIKEYLAAQPEPKRSEMQELHDMILALMPACKLWFLDGKDEKEKLSPTQILDMVAKPFNTPMEKPGDFYQIGVSANTTGISVYIMGVDDKKYLAQTFGRDLGKASVTGLLHQIQNVSRYKRRCSQGSNTVWDWADKHSTLIQFEVNDCHSWQWMCICRSQSGPAIADSSASRFGLVTETLASRS